MQTRPRHLARFALLLYVLCLGVILFQPVPSIASGTVLGVDDLLVQWGVPVSWVAPGRVEFVLNALMFSPLAFLGFFVVRRSTWSDWVAWTFIGSASVEVFQGVMLPARSAQFVDIVANTLGGLLGAIAALLLARFLTSRDSPQSR